MGTRAGRPPPSPRTPPTPRRNHVRASASSSSQCNAMRCAITSACESCRALPHAGKQLRAARMWIVQCEAGEDSVLAWLWGPVQRSVLCKSGSHNIIFDCGVSRGPHDPCPPFCASSSLSLTSLCLIRVGCRLAAQV